MSVGSALKQSLHTIFLLETEALVVLAVFVAVFNSLCNSLNDALFIAFKKPSLHSSTELDRITFAIGTSLFAIGISVEIVSEFQRAIAKRQPTNQGKLFTGGLFVLCRHPNYFGYLLWRTGYALAGGGWLWALLVGSAFAWIL